MLKCPRCENLIDKIESEMDCYDKFYCPIDREYFYRPRVSTRSVINEIDEVDKVDILRLTGCKSIEHVLQCFVRIGDLKSNGYTEKYTGEY